MTERGDAAALFARFIAACAFLHDDWNPLLGEDDWDQFDTNPFLLGAHTCVATTLEGFGDAYVAYLRGLGCFPENVIQPRRTSERLGESLLRDGEALARLRRIVAERELDLSSFYASEAMSLEPLAAALAQDGGRVPAVHPPSREFRRGDDKAAARRLFQEADVPFPEGRMCETREEILRFAAEMGADSPLLLKSGHRDLIEVAHPSELFGLQERLTFPVLAEKRYAFRASPACHFVAWRGRCEHLFTVNQILRDWHHAGNETPVGVGAAVEAKITDYTRRILERLPAFTGAFVVDFVVTEDDEALAVDLNPRFGASTYPFFLLQRLGRNPCDTFARSRICRRRVRDLSAVFGDQRFVPFDKGAGRGILLFNPVVDLEQKTLRHFSYLAVGADAGDLDDLEAGLADITG